MNWLIAGLIVLNIPIYVFLAWVLFYNEQTKGETLFETVVNILLSVIFLPMLRSRRRSIFEGPAPEEDRGAAFDFLPAVGYLIACIAITYGEYWLIQRYCFPPAESVTLFFS